MKISTWNVNSVNARIEHLEKFINKDQSDIYLLQELKTIEDGFPKEIIKNSGYHSYVNGQKAWNGVAILSKNEIISEFQLNKINSSSAIFDLNTAINDNTELYTLRSAYCVLAAYSRVPYYDVLLYYEVNTAGPSLYYV